MGKKIILIPTYNERENLKLLLPLLREKFPDIDVLIIDDNSPDGSADVVRRFSYNDGSIKLLLRKKKQGLGYALFAGYQYAIENGYEKIIQMDADFSHPPEYISQILSFLSPDTVVVCSRYLKGGGSEGWSFWRIFISICANKIVRFILGIHISDATSGYRGFSRSFLEKFIKQQPLSSGYLLQVESIFKARKWGYRVKEIPFIYKKRNRGSSKLNILEVLRSGYELIKMKFKDKIASFRY